MRDHYDETIPGGGPWPPGPPGPPRRSPARGYDDEYSWFAEPAAARAQGLRRLSRLTWRATQLSALATVGFIALFVRSAPAQTVSAQAKPAPSVKVITVSPSPSPSPAHKKHKKRHRHAAAPAAPAPSATLAPPTTAPAPPPSTAPVQSTSGGSGGG